MQHEIEDKALLTTLETAWKQVEEKSNEALKGAVVSALNALKPENIVIMSKKFDEKEVENDDIDVDPETGRASGNAWTEIEVRTKVSFDVKIPEELASKLNEFDSTELDNMLEKLIEEAIGHKNEILPFIELLEAVSNEEFEEMYEYEGYDKEEKNIYVTLLSYVDDEGSRDATNDMHDAAAERKDPYGYRGLSRSDFI